MYSVTKLCLQFPYLFSFFTICEILNIPPFLIILSTYTITLSNCNGSFLMVHLISWNLVSQSFSIDWASLLASFSDNSQHWVPLQGILACAPSVTVIFNQNKDLRPRCCWYGAFDIPELGLSVQVYRLGFFTGCFDTDSFSIAFAHCSCAISNHFQFQLVSYGIGYILEGLSGLLDFLLTVFKLTSTWNDFGFNWSIVAILVLFK